VFLESVNSTAFNATDRQQIPILSITLFENTYFLTFSLV